MLTDQATLFDQPPLSARRRSSDSAVTLWPGSEERKLVEVDEFGNEIPRPERAVVRDNLKGRTEVELNSVDGSDGFERQELSARKEMPKEGLRKKLEC